MLILELEMDTVQAEVVNLQDDVVELRNQDSLTDLRLITAEEDIASITFQLYFLHLKYLADFALCSFLPTAKEVWGKVMFYTCLSVIQFTEGGVCPIACWDTRPLGRHPLGQTPPRETPPSRIIWDTVNKRVVRILLEFILVMIQVCFTDD